MDSVSGANSDLWTLFWQILGALGMAVFYGRFYIQWVVSERAGRSVVPVAFWYMSGAGSVALLLYGFHTNSPLGVLSHCFNSVVYARNLVHIWNEKGKLTRRLSVVFQGAVAVFVIAGLAMVAYVWLREYHSTHGHEPSVIAKTWFWIGLGVGGQMLFAARFAVQWAVSEMLRKSVIPPVFWYLSAVASLLMFASHSQRHEWYYALGLLATLPVYLRNIWLIHAGRAAEAGE